MSANTDESLGETDASNGTTLQAPVSAVFDLEVSTHATSSTRSQR
jgi:hypothetical protein